MHVSRSSRVEALSFLLPRPKARPEERAQVSDTT